MIECHKGKCWNTEDFISMMENEIKQEDIIRQIELDQLKRLKWPPHFLGTVDIINL